MSSTYPYQWVEIPDDELQKVYRNPTRKYVRSIPGDVWMPLEFKDIAEKIYNFEVRPDDIWVITYPKCGTTWTQELVWQIVNNVDIAKSKESPLYARSPYLEFEVMLPQLLKEKLLDGSNVTKEQRKFWAQITTGTMEFVDKCPSPRVIKSHIPISMLPPALFTSGCKVVYVCRNPMDTCVSYYHHNKSVEGENADDIEHFEEMFFNGTFEYGSYWHHLKDALKYKEQKNLKIVWYEEMKKDLIKVIREMASFLGYHLTELKILTLDDFLYIGNHREHGAASMSNGDEEVTSLMRHFFRKGQIGDWKNHFSGDKLVKWDNWIKDNLKGTDINFTFE